MYFSRISPERERELVEAVGLLRSAGLGPLAEAMLDPVCYTRKGRLNVSALSRLMRIPVASIHQLLAEARTVLESGGYSGDN